MHFKTSCTKTPLASSCPYL